MINKFWGIHRKTNFRHLYSFWNLSPSQKQPHKIENHHTPTSPPASHVTCTCTDVHSTYDYLFVFLSFLKTSLTRHAITTTCRLVVLLWHLQKENMPHFIWRNLQRERASPPPRHTCTQLTVASSATPPSVCSSASCTGTRIIETLVKLRRRPPECPPLHLVDWCDRHVVLSCPRSPLCDAEVYVCDLEQWTVTSGIPGYLHVIVPDHR